MGLRGKLRGAGGGADARRRPLRPLTMLVFAVAGLMMATGALASRGNDLRPDRTTEMATLVRAEADHADALARRVAALRTEVDELTAQHAEDAGGPSASELQAAAGRAGATAVTGPAVSVTLTDAPASVQPAGVDGDLLVVHQQDIQAVVNALWAGGAEAMTIQGQRVGARTGIKCVGNTVVIHGVPYAPPYVIVAIGNQAAMERSLGEDAYLMLYRQDVDSYRLGYEVARPSSVTMPGYSGPSELVHASAVR